MILANHHVLVDLRELWGFRSFRIRVFFAVVFAVVAGVLSFLMADTKQPFEFIEEGSYIVPPAGKAGEQMTVYWNGKRNRYCPGLVHRKLVDPNTGVVLAVYDPIPASFTDNTVAGMVVRNFTLPRTLQSGPVGYQVSLTFTCNWLQVLLPNTFAIRYNSPRLLFVFEP